MKLETGADGAERLRTWRHGSTIRRWHALHGRRGALLAVARGRRRARAAARPPARGGSRRPARPSTGSCRARCATSVPAAVYDVDGFETTAAEVAALHAAGKRVVCYVDVGTAENFRPDYSSFPKSVLGRSNGWPGERWLDIRRTRSRSSRSWPPASACARKRASTPSSRTTSKRSPTTAASRSRAADQLAFNLWVARSGPRPGHGGAAEERRRTGRSDGAELRRRAHRAVQPVLRMRPASRRICMPASR